MAVLIKAVVDRATGLASLRFPFDRPTIDTVKSCLGTRWNPDKKAWTCPYNLIPVLQSWGLVINVSDVNARQAIVPPVIAERLRPYQLEGADLLIKNRGFLLTFEQRVGKTPTLIAAATALMSAGHADACLVLYPAGVLGTWEKELREWANTKLNYLETYAPFDDQEMWDLKTTPFLFLGCHYDLLGRRGPDLHRLLSGRRYIVIADEAQHLQNRKLDRTKTAFALSHGLPAHAQWYSKSDEVVEEGPFDVVNPGTGELHAVPCGVPVASWGSTGTPQRNYPKNLWGVLHFVLQGCVSSYQRFTERYCDGHKDELGHWDDWGTSNEDELAARLRGMSFRKLRAEVAEWLPKTDRNVIMCEMEKDQLKSYKKLERHFAPQAASALSGRGESQAAEAGLRQLVAATSAAKIPTAIERARLHAHDRGVKVICAAHFHETLMGLDNAFDQEAPSWQDGAAPHFCAGGWKTPAKRREIIEQWRSCPGPSILLINSLSSGVGIDLADAEVMIHLELEWVPADLGQLEARIQDMHLGKRKTPPIHEYLLAKYTVDESMAKALLEKIKSIEAVVGKDVETAGVASALRGTDLTESGRLGLPDNNRETVLAALLSINARWGEVSGEADDGKAALAGDFAAHWDDEEAVEEEVAF